MSEELRVAPYPPAHAENWLRQLHGRFSAALMSLFRTLYKLTQAALEKIGDLFGHISNIAQKSSRGH